ncbi:MAG: alanine racemase [Candidatus Hydrogenedentota bacterium]
MNKLTYERPAIIRQVDGLMNKVGRPAPARPFDEIDGVRIDDLVAQYGSPLFVFSERTIRHRIREAMQTFSVRYPRVQFAWSYKTNYLDAICRIFHQEGSIAEVVSEMEYLKARRNGMLGSQIIYNGPYKTEASLKQAAAEGAMIHVDNFEEIAALEAVSDELGKKLDVGIRINLDSQIYPQWDRFGFNLESYQAYHAVKRMVSGGKLNLVTFHCHLGTFILDPWAYARAIVKLLDFAAYLRAEFKIVIRNINMGGGFASSNTLHQQYLPGEQVSPSLAQYADAISSVLMSSPIADQLNLILESGRSLVDEAGSLISTVRATKRLASGRRAIVLDAGVNLLFTAYWYKLQILPVQPFQGLSEETTVYGPLCMNIDCVRDGVVLPDLQKGDRVAIRPAGAYCFTQSMQFIALRPACILLGMNGEIDCIRRAEVLEDLVACESLPDRLAGEPAHQQDTRTSRVISISR